jgi:hypothetical protein
MTVEESSYTSHGRRSVNLAVETEHLAGQLDLSAGKLYADVFTSVNLAASLDDQL